MPIADCPTCKGEGTLINGQICRICKGTGEIVVNKVLEKDKMLQVRFSNVLKDN